MYIKYFLLDVPKLSWLEEHSRSLLFLGSIAFVAIAVLVGIFIYRRKQKTKNNV